MRERVSAIVRGRVQGLNFRSMVKLRALTLGLVGTVQNLPDGTVAIEAEGERPALETLLHWVNTDPGGVEVEQVDDRWSEPTGQYRTFEILV